VIIHPDHSNKPLTFNKIFTHKHDQFYLYNNLGFKVVESFTQGYNTTVFVYGQTGTGKTHTIFGSDSVVN